MYGVLAAAPLVLICIALTMQYVYLMEPCPLCVVQRLIFILIGLAFICKVIFFRITTAMLYLSITSVIFSLSGVGVAGRHVWLQHFPSDNLPGCLPSFSYLIESLPIGSAVIKILNGSADCTKVQWTFLGLSIPEQTLVIFCLYSVFCALIAFSAAAQLRQRRSSAAGDSG